MFSTRNLFRLPSSTSFSHTCYMWWLALLLLWLTYSRARFRFVEYFFCSCWYSVLELAALQYRETVFRGRSAFRRCSVSGGDTEVPPIFFAASPSFPWLSFTCPLPVFAISFIICCFLVMCVIFARRPFSCSHDRFSCSCSIAFSSCC